MNTETENVTQEAPAEPSIAKVYFRTRIESAADTTNGRYVLNNIRIYRGEFRDWACATNGQIAAAAPCDGGDTPDRTLIPAEPIRRMRRLARLNRKKPDTWAVLIEGRRVSIRSSSGLSIESPVGEGRFPKVDDAFHEVSEETHYSLGIDAGLLKQLADAISMDGERQCLTLFISKDNREAPIAAVGDMGIGCIMPLSDHPGVKSWERYADDRESFVKAFTKSEASQ